MAFTYGEGGSILSSDDEKNDFTWTSRVSELFAVRFGNQAFKASGRLKSTLLGSWIRKNSASSEFLRIQLRQILLRR